MAHPRVFLANRSAMTAARIRRLTLNNFRSYHAAQIDIAAIWWC